MLPKVAIAFLLLTVLGFFVIKDKLPNNSQIKPSLPSQNQGSKPLIAEEVLKLGGTCFTKSFEDQTNYLESQKDGSPDIVKVTDKPKFDTQKVSLGIKDNQVVFQFDFKEAPGIDKHHALRFWIYHDIGNPRDEDRIEVQWIPAEEKWTGTFNTAGTFGSKPQQFEPRTEISDTAIRFEVPKYLLAKDGQIEKINFTTLVVDKQEQITYVDRLWASEGGPSSKFTCPKNKSNNQVSSSAKGVVIVQGPTPKTSITSPLTISGFVYGNNGTLTIKLKQKESGQYVTEDKVVSIKGSSDKITFAESLQFGLPAMPQPGILEIEYKDASGKGLDDKVSVEVNFPSDLGSGR